MSCPVHRHVLRLYSSAALRDREQHSGAGIRRWRRLVDARGTGPPLRVRKAGRRRSGRWCHERAFGSGQVWSCPGTPVGAPSALGNRFDPPWSGLLERGVRDADHRDRLQASVLDDDLFLSPREVDDAIVVAPSWIAAQFGREAGTTHTPVRQAGSAAAFGVPYDLSMQVLDPAGVVVGADEFALLPVGDRAVLRGRAVASLVGRGPGADRRLAGWDGLPNQRVAAAARRGDRAAHRRLRREAAAPLGSGSRLRLADGDGRGGSGSQRATSAEDLARTGRMAGRRLARAARAADEEARVETEFGNDEPLGRGNLADGDRMVHLADDDGRGRVSGPRRQLAVDAAVPAVGEPNVADGDGARPHHDHGEGGREVVPEAYRGMEARRADGDPTRGCCRRSTRPERRGRGLPQMAHDVARSVTSVRERPNGSGAIHSRIVHGVSHGHQVVM